MLIIGDFSFQAYQFFLIFLSFCIVKKKLKHLLKYKHTLKKLKEQTFVQLFLKFHLEILLFGVYLNKKVFKKNILLLILSFLIKRREFNFYFFKKIQLTISWLKKIVHICTKVCAQIPLMN